jgi:hypothetical protein
VNKGDTAKDNILQNKNRNRNYKCKNYEGDGTAS